MSELAHENVFTPRDRIMCVGHTTDIEKLYGRFKETENELSHVKTRVSSIEQRLSNMETGLHDIRRTQNDLTVRVDNIGAEVHRISTTQDILKDLITSLTATFTQHMVDESVRQAEQVTATHDQTIAIERQTKTIWRVFMAVGVLTITAVSLASVFIEDGFTFAPLLNVFGFGG